MTPNAERVALLRAIAASPDEDVPRLAFADWLDEHAGAAGRAGGSGGAASAADSAEADRARAEFIRLACGMKPKARITKAEQQWLAERWRQLLPSVSGLLKRWKARPEHHSWSGRWLRVWHHAGGNNGLISAELEFWRGFVRRVAWAGGFEKAAAAVAADEPLARHALGQNTPLRTWSLADGRRRCGVAPEWCGGRAVWERLAGYDAAADEPGRARKMYDQPPGPNAWQALDDRVRAAISNAMTAVARARAGWPDDLPTLG